MSSGINRPFGRLSPCPGHVTHLLLTLAPVVFHPDLRRESFSPRDLHVLATPPAFVLSQDQTLQSLIRVLRPRGRRGITFWLKHSLSRRLQECLRPHLCGSSRPAEATASAPGGPHSRILLTVHFSKIASPSPNWTVEGQMMPKQEVKVKRIRKFFSPAAGFHAQTADLPGGPARAIALAFYLPRVRPAYPPAPWPWFASAPPFASHSGNLPGPEVSSITTYNHPPAKE